MVNVGNCGKGARQRTPKVNVGGVGMRIQDFGKGPTTWNLKNKSETCILLDDLGILMNLDKS